GTGAGGEAQRSYPPTTISGGHPGGHRWKSGRARNDQRVAQRRNREMLRRRHHAQTQTARKTKRREETDEIDRLGAHSAGSLHRGVKGLNGNVDSSLVSLQESPASPRYVPAGAQTHRRSARFAVARGASGNLQN